jgi:hypothetical protein
MKAKKKYDKGGKVDPPKIPFSKEQIRKIIDSGNTQMYYAPDRAYNQDEFPWLNTNTPREGSKDIYVAPENFPNKSIYIDEIEEDGTVRGRWGQRGSNDPLNFNRVELYDFVLPAEQKEVSGLPIKEWRSKMKPLKMVDPFPNVYDRKMDASGTKAIYNTDKGRIVKKKGKEDADFVRLMTRLGRNYR